MDAGVSLLESASRYLVEKKLRSMEQGLDEKITSYNKTSIKWRKGKDVFFVYHCSTSINENPPLLQTLVSTQKKMFL